MISVTFTPKPVEAELDDKDEWREWSSQITESQWFYADDINDDSVEWITQSEFKDVAGHYDRMMVIIKHLPKARRQRIRAIRQAIDHIGFTHIMRALVGTIDGRPVVLIDGILEDRDSIPQEAVENPNEL